jgi:YHS domain-containing protein
MKIKPFLILFVLLMAVHFAYGQTGDGTDVNAPNQNDPAENTELVCAVSGEKIEAGNEVKFNYLGREYVFSSDENMAKFKKEPLDYIKGELTCPVMNDPAEKDTFFVHEGVKYYLCCTSCQSKFERNPDKYIKKFDKN